MIKMKQTSSRISTYADDVSGVCSALYELGGMTVIHDASKGNSTYNMHDDPRWYDMNNMLYISELKDIESMNRGDTKLIRDIIYTAKQLNPKFISIAYTPIPDIMDKDFFNIASIIEKESNIPTFQFKTNGVNSYVVGASMAFEYIGKEFVHSNVSSKLKNTVNILGATPLDFSVNKSIESIKEILKENGFNLISTWAMGSDLEQMKNASMASVNLVISYSGLKIAKYLYDKFHIPYVIGTPYGRWFSKKMMDDLHKAIDKGENIISYDFRNVKENPEVIIIGEGIMSESLAAAIYTQEYKNIQVISSLECDENVLLRGDCIAMNEDNIRKYLNKTQIIIADPLYKSICPDGCKFIPLPHEGLSGRIYRNEIPNLIGKLQK